MSPQPSTSQIKMQASEKEKGYLPQYGFGPELSFQELVTCNKFLFRVYTPRQDPTSNDSVQSVFLGKSFKDNTRNKRRFQDAQTFEDVSIHMNWETRTSSPYITTSFSFAWAIWEAVRRRRMNVKHDVHIAVIDAKKISDRAITALELLRKATGKEKDKEYWKWYRFALEAQDVLVFGHIPGDAIFTSIPIVSVLRKLPPYFLADEMVEDVKGASDVPVTAWDPSARPYSFRLFCEFMSQRFLHLSMERRLYESTAGAVRLSVCLLQPWFRAKLLEDSEIAVSNVRDLAYLIARWPAAWWVRDRPEIWDTLGSMVRIAGEEIRQGDKNLVKKHVERMQTLVEQLGEPLPDDWEFLPTSRQISRQTEDDVVPIANEIQNDIQVQVPLLAEHRDVETTQTAGKRLQSAGERGENAVTRKLPRKVGESASANGWTSLARVSSWALTSLLAGVIVTLFMISSQRRTLANNLT